MSERRSLGRRGRVAGWAAAEYLKSKWVASGFAHMNSEILHRLYFFAFCRLLARFPICFGCHGSSPFFGCFFRVLLSRASFEIVPVGARYFWGIPALIVNGWDRGGRRAKHAAIFVMVYSRIGFW